MAVNIFGDIFLDTRRDNSTVPSDYIAMKLGEGTLHIGIAFIKVASILEIRDRIKSFTKNLTKFQILAIEADRAE